MAFTMGCTKEIRIVTAMGKAALNKLFRTRNINLEVKKKLIMCGVLHCKVQGRRDINKIIECKINQFGHENYLK